MKEYLFVYGIFRDYGRTLLGDYIHCGKASVCGKIYKVNEFYPGFVDSIKGSVIGDVYLVDPEVFMELDEFEGSEYQRTKIKTSTDLECWIYRYINDISPFKEIDSGDWILR